MVTDKILRNVEIINKENVGGDFLSFQDVHGAKKKKKKNLYAFQKECKPIVITRGMTTEAFTKAMKSSSKS